MTALKLLDPDKIDEAITDGLVMLDFWQEACPPCRVLEPRLDTFARNHNTDLTIYRIDIETDQQTASEPPPG